MIILTNLYTVNCNCIFLVMASPGLNPLQTEQLSHCMLHIATTVQRASQHEQFTKSDSCKFAKGHKASLAFQLSELLLLLLLLLCLLCPSREVLVYRLTFFFNYRLTTFAKNRIISAALSGQNKDLKWRVAKGDGEEGAGKKT